MKLDKMFTVKRRIIIYKIQIMKIYLFGIVSSSANALLIAR